MKMKKVRTLQVDKKPAKPKHISSLIQSLIKDLDKKQLCSKEEIDKVWEDVVGKRDSIHAWPTSLTKGVLKISVDNPGWIYQLTTQKRTILKKLQSYFGKDKITHIHFRTGVK